MIYLIVVIVVAVLTYRTARDNGRSPLVWVMAVVGVGILFGFILPFGVGMVVAVALLLSGENQSQIVQDIGNWSTLINITTAVAGIGGMLYVVKRASILPDGPPLSMSPPPPPIFEEN